MQSHASRHVVSEFLEDLHPCSSEPFPKGVIKDEIAEAYGRRSIPKLIAVLEVPKLPDQERAHCLRILNSMLTNQESKLQAISLRAVKSLTRLVQNIHSDVSALSCNALASLAQVMQGRLSLQQEGSIKVLTTALFTTPLAAATALKQMSCSIDGVAMLLKAPCRVVASLVDLISNKATSLESCEQAVATLAGITTTDAGILDSLKVQVPKCVVKLADRAFVHNRKTHEDVALRVMTLCAECLQQISHHAYGKTQIREANGISVLATLVTTHDTPLLRKTTAALMSLSIEEESKLPVMREAGSTLADLMHYNSDPDIVDNCRAALVNSCDDLNARKSLEMLMDAKEMGPMLGALSETPPDYRYHVDTPGNLIQAEMGVV